MAPFFFFVVLVILLIRYPLPNHHRHHHHLPTSNSVKQESEIGGMFGILTDYCISPLRHREYAAPTEFSRNSNYNVFRNSGVCQTILASAIRKVACSDSYSWRRRRSVDRARTILDHSMTRSVLISATSGILKSDYFLQLLLPQVFNSRLNSQR